jgi:hypothetical protein
VRVIIHCFVRRHGMMAMVVCINLDCVCLVCSYYGNSFFGGEEGAVDFSVAKFMEVRCLCECI